MTSTIPHVKLQLVLKKDIFIIDCYKGESVMEAIARNGIYFSAACGGKGTCGKCKLQLLKGGLNITMQDKKLLSKEELRNGFRLSCKAYPIRDCTILLKTGDESDFDIVTANRNKLPEESNHQENSYVIAIDLGTTTLAISLVGTTSKRTLRTHTMINKQRAYGFDVISRIMASNEGKKHLLRDMIQKDLTEGIRTVIAEEDIKKNSVAKIVIAGNTTMGHLLMGYSCETLGVFPFQPFNIKMVELDFNQMFASDILDLPNVPVVLMPGISTYVGGDITAGLLLCEFDKLEKPCMLIDLGTNGEMAIGNKNSILVTSTAAGPAFEGGNLSCGVGSVKGAISHMLIGDNEVSYQTIGDIAPIGICGTGVVDVVSELLRTGIIDDTGLLSSKYFEDGYTITDKEQTEIVLTQKDIRELQLAKAAVRAGIETLIHCYGITYQQIDTVYLAGGFGYKIDLEKAIHIGLLPEELRGKIIAIGNSSLAGAVKYLTEEGGTEKLNHILSISKEIHLSNEEYFNDLYIKHMYFAK